MTKSLDKEKEAAELIERGLKHVLRQPRPKVSEREWKALRWRWEFLRLNDAYQQVKNDVSGFQIHDSLFLITAKLRETYTLT